MNKIKELLLFFITIIVFTNSYALISYVSGVSINVISAAVMIATLLVVFFSINQMKLKINSRWLLIFAFFLIFSPLIIVILTGKIYSREITLNVFYFLLFINGYLAFNIKYRNVAINIGLTITVIAAIISVIEPRIFIPLMNLAESRDNYWGRAFGLYLQPNSLAFSTLLMFLTLYVVYKAKTNLLLYFIILSASVVLLSGSRTSYFCLFVTSIILIYGEVGNRDINLKKYLSKLLVTVLVLIVSITVYFNSSERFKDSDLLNRINIVGELFEGKALNVDDDKSLLSREKKQEPFIEAIKDSPIVGYGFGAQQYTKFNGSSHNTYLDVLFQGGAVFLVIYVLFILIIFFKTKNSRVHVSYKTPIYCLLFIVVFYGFFSNTVIQSRPLYFVSGFLIAYFVSCIRKVNSQYLIEVK